MMPRSLVVAGCPLEEQAASVLISTPSCVTSHPEISKTNRASIDDAVEINEQK